jgi:hypothetical protein
MKPNRLEAPNCQLDPNLWFNGIIDWGCTGYHIRPNSKIISMRILLNPAGYRILYIYKPYMSSAREHAEGQVRWRCRQSKHLSPLRSWVRFSLWTHVKRVVNALPKVVSPGAHVSSLRESRQGGLE